MNEIKTILAKIRPTLDKARKIADAADSAINKLDSSLAGKLAKAIPGIGSSLAALVLGCQVLTEVLDSVDSLVDLNS